MKDFKIRCSAISQIMTNAKGKSNLERFNEAKKTLEESIARFEKMKTKDGITGLKLKKKIYI